MHFCFWFIAGCGFSLEEFILSAGPGLDADWWGGVRHFGVAGGYASLVMHPYLVWH